MFTITNEMEIINTELFLDTCPSEPKLQLDSDFSFDDAISAEIRANAAAINYALEQLGVIIKAEPIKAALVHASGYKRKYETATEILSNLLTTSSRKEIASLYYVNAELIEATPWLSKAFTDRKARFYFPYMKAVA
jgi:hypothetical protein